MLQWQEDKFHLRHCPMATFSINRVELSFQLAECWFSNGLVSSLVRKMLQENWLIGRLFIVGNKTQTAT